MDYIFPGSRPLVRRRRTHKVWKSKGPEAALTPGRCLPEPVPGVARAESLHDNEIAMTDEPPTSEQWQKLYEAAVRVKELSPWEWMNEADVFGVADPEDEEIGFVSVMGMLGEHYAVSLYPNPDALYSLLALEEAGPAINPDAVLEIPQIQLSFEDRGELAHADRQMIKDLGFKFRGRKQWPMFRSYRHGYAPWFIEAGEARSLAQALEQLLEVAPRFREDPSLLDPDENSYPVRVPRQQAGEMVWEDAAVEVPPPEPEPIQIQMDTATLQSLQSLPQAGYDLQMDLFMFPTPRAGEQGPAANTALHGIDRGGRERRGSGNRVPDRRPLSRRDVGHGAGEGGRSTSRPRNQTCGRYGELGATLTTTATSG